MAKGGAFGNPLTTGIALNFEVDMTPYRQMMQDNLKFAQTQAADRKKKEKEFQDILKNITYDDSKILKRRRDGARVEYASLINDVINLNKNGDRGGVQNRIADFRSGMNNLVDEKTNFNLYEKAAREGKSWTSAEYINAMNGLNEGETSDESILKLYPDEIDYDSKSGTFASQAIPKADAMSWANKILQGRSLKSTNQKPEFVPETGEYRFPLSKVEDPEAFYKEMGALWLGGGESHVETMRRERGLTSDDLDGTGAIDNSTEYMRSLFQDKVEGERYGRPLAPKTGRAGGKTPFEKVVVQDPVSQEVNVMSEPQMQEVVIGQDAIDRMFDPASPGSVTSDSFKMEQDEGESYLIEAMRGLGFETEATGTFGADKVVVKNPKTNKTHTVEFDYDEDDEQNKRDRELEKLRNWINNNATREQQEVAGEPALSYNQTVAFPSSKIFDMPVGKNDIIVDESGGKVIEFETQDLPVEVQETVTDKDGNRWYKATVFADVTAQAIASGTIFDPTASEGEPGYERPKIQRTVFIKEDQAKLRKMAAKLGMSYDEILKLTRGTKGGKTNNYGI